MKKAIVCLLSVLMFINILYLFWIIVFKKILWITYPLFLIVYSEKYVFWIYPILSLLLLITVCVLFCCYYRNLITEKTEMQKTEYIKRKKERLKQKQEKIQNKINALNDEGKPE